MPVRHEHNGTPCSFTTKKACEDNYADWQAMQQVLLALKVVVEGRTPAFKKEKSQFAQLVLIIAGEQVDFTTDDGVPARAPWVMRLRAAMERVKVGALPLYNLVQPVAPVEER